MGEGGSDDLFCLNCFWLGYILPAHIQRFSGGSVNLFLRIGTSVVLLALMSYSVSIIQLMRFKLVSTIVTRYLVLGVCLDIAATLCMILGSSRGLFTFHGILGYSALLLMIADTALLFRFKRRSGMTSPLTGWLQRFSLAAYSWWVVAFITGAFLAMHTTH